MSSTSETGHAKNVANFEDLMSFVKGYGATYNPSKASIKLTALQPVLTSANNSVNAVNSVFPSYSNAVSARVTAFKPLSKLITRVMNALKATDVTEQVIESAKTFSRKIQGARASTKLTEEAKKQLTEQGKEQKEASASQMSYDMRLDNFDKLIQLLSSVPLYAPNEADLKVTALTKLYNDLKTKNSAVVSAAMPLSNARIARNEVLYKKNTGLYYIALDVKTYVKSLFGTISPQYKQISKLKFTKPR